MIARHAFPVATTLLLMLLANAPLGIPGQAGLVPAVAVVSVFFWSLFRPASLPPLAVFLSACCWTCSAGCPWASER